MAGGDPAIVQMKLAEKLTILRSRGVGMITRIYNIKKACGDVKSKPGFLSDKALEGPLKHIQRRFPNTDIKQLSALQPLKTEVLKSLSLYYYTFADLLDFKDHVSQLLTTIDAKQIHLDITQNFDLTKLYLDVVSLYIRLMILLSRVDDRKAVLGMFNAAHEMVHGGHDPQFPRLGQMIVDYDPPLKKLSEEFVPHARTLNRALVSLAAIYPRRNLNAEQWRSAQMLSLTANPNQLLNPAHTDTIPCEYLSLATIEHWIVFGYAVCHSHLAQQGQNPGPPDDLWKLALQSGWVMMLFRDEVIYIHEYIQKFFDTLKGYRRKVDEVKELYNLAVQNASAIHRERRKFLRSAVREMALLCADQPGLLGPKALFIFMGLCFCRDEVIWLIHHAENPPAKNTKGANRVQEDLIDRHIPELLFYMEELRGLVKKYNQVIQRYYVQYLSGYDAVALNQCIQNLHNLTDDESILLSSIWQSISHLTVEQVEDPEHTFDFRGLRLDWTRLQSYLSTGGSKSVKLDEFKATGGAGILNTVVFHTRMVDQLEAVLVETSDLSIFCFYARLFEDYFQMCLEFPAQNRYIISFPLICSHFSQISNDFCPEERSHIKERSLSIINLFLDEMSKEAKNIITTICDEQCKLSDQLLPKHCAAVTAENARKKKNAKGGGKGHHDRPESRPGAESYRKTREDLTVMDKLHMALTELSFSINYVASINVWDYSFAPREYLNQHLETRFAKAVAGMVMHEPEKSSIAKPSELVTSVRAYMNVLQTVENHIHIDMTRIFNSVLLQQTQQLDSGGTETIARNYTDWYSNVLLRRVSAGHICFSPTLKSFVSLTAEGAIPFNAEEFTDPSELQALAELLGPYGIRLLNENLIWHVGTQVQEMKKLVLQNDKVLTKLRTNFDKPEVMKELATKLVNADIVLQRMTVIGVVLSFRQLLYDALNTQLSERIPFLYTAISDFHQHSLPDHQSLLINEMASAAGFPSRLDPMIIQCIQNLARPEAVEMDDYQVSCLLMVFVAVSIPRLARSDSSIYKAPLEAHANNIHCLALAVNQVFGALFSLSPQQDVEDRLKEFLALASSSLLRLAQENDKESIRNRESVYILLDLIVQNSPFLSMDLLESCFPYTLLRNSYHIVHKLGSMHLTAPGLVNKQSL